MYFLNLNFFKAVCMHIFKSLYQKLNHITFLSKVNLCKTDNENECLTKIIIYKINVFIVCHSRCVHIFYRGMNFLYIDSQTDR